MTDIEAPALPLLQSEPCSRKSGGSKRKRCNKCWREWRYVYSEMVAPRVPTMATMRDRCCSVLEYMCALSLVLVMSVLGVLLALAIVCVLAWIGIAQNALYAGVVSGCLSHARPIDCAANASWSMYAPLDCHTRVNETHYAPANWTSGSRMRWDYDCNDKALYTPGLILLGIEVGLVLAPVVLVFLYQEFRLLMHGWWQRVQAHRARCHSLDD